MGNYKEIEGNLITLAQEGFFDVITHGCNCHCTMGAGIAPQMAKAFGCDKFPLEDKKYKGDINKLGQIDWKMLKAVETETKTMWMDLNWVDDDEVSPKTLSVVNSYTQYDFHGPKLLDYEALTLCLRKMNKVFKGFHVGLPQIGAGLAKGDWNTIKQIIQTELKDCDVTVVIYKP